MTLPKTISGLFVGLLLLMVGPFLPAQATTSTPSPSIGTAVTAPPRELLFWKAVRGRSVLYLLGAIHLAGPEIYPLNPAITTAFTSSSTLIVEIDVQRISPAVLRKLVKKYGYYPDTDSLDRHLSADLLQKVLDWARRVNFPAESALRMRPWMLESVLSTVQAGDTKLSAADGVDNHFLTIAHGDGMKIEGLETAAEQLESISAMSEELQVRSLEKAVMGIQEDHNDLLELYEAWKKGDLKKFTELVVAPFDTDDQMRAVFEDLFAVRNKRWVTKLDRIAAGDGTRFMVVGAGHLVGPDNVRDLLAANGWTVTRVTPQNSLPAGAEQ
ncbi:MAG TPA: TraB/GumN family protein [Spirochaetia bacterium]|nr:TraB/GumN family protein [Spirochaetia bacterium]